MLASAQLVRQAGHPHRPALLPNTSTSALTTDPEILPPDAPVWGGPSKTAKMSPAARGVFIRQWYARPENQIDMFVGSGGSGVVGRKMAFDVAYTGATAAEVQVC